MLDFANIDAIQFLRDSVNNIRVYYQNADKVIRESCFNDKQKWYAAGNAVASARENSPIIVTGWNGGTEIRVYYLNTNNKICETVGRSVVGGATTWEQGGDLSDATVAVGSQLGIARPGKDDDTLRIYYQEATTNKIREIMYWEENGWSVSALEIPGALPGSHISAVSAKPPGDIRLYYQGAGDGNLKEYFFKQQSRQWSPSDFPPLPLIPKAPICAVCWYADNEKNTPQDLRIRVFTIPKANSSSVAQIVFNLNQGWNSRPTPLVSVLANPPNYISAIAACQTANVAKGAISVFYQPESKVIDLKPVGVSGGDAALGEAKAVVTPRGIPIFQDSW